MPVLRLQFLPCARYAAAAALSRRARERPRAEPSAGRRTRTRQRLPGRGHAEPVQPRRDRRRPGCRPASLHAGRRRRDHDGGEPGHRGVRQPGRLPRRRRQPPVDRRTELRQCSAEGARPYTRAGRDRGERLRGARGWFRQPQSRHHVLPARPGRRPRARRHRCGDGARAGTPVLVSPDARAEHRVSRSTPTGPAGRGARSRYPGRGLGAALRAGLRALRDIRLGPGWPALST